LVELISKNEEGDSKRKRFNGLVKRTTKTEVGDGGQKKRVYGLVEIVSKGEVGERGRKASGKTSLIFSFRKFLNL
jgi:hypothetical protein